ncbi:MAG: NAD(P)H-dependent oxidoreductase [Flavobacteriaceae bacterium]
MKEHLILFAHPYEDSFCSTIKNAVLAQNKENGVNTTVRDLYELNFNPLLSSKEIVALQQGQQFEDVLLEQKLINKADVIHIIYPIWWTQMPAVLKGYIDRVFSNGFAYKSIGHHQFEGLLKNKKVFVFNTIGTTMKVSIDEGLISAMKTLLHKGFIEYVGMDVSSHQYFNPFEMQKEEFETTLQEIKNTLNNFNQNE